MKKITLTILFCSASLAALADKVRILEAPADAAQARVDLIQQAKNSIDAQYYIVGDDYFSLAGLALLRDAARRGCSVRLIIDGRSNKIPRAVHAHLRREKVMIKLYHPITLRHLEWITRRMHDKGLNVDGRRMIRGGRNIEGNYFGYAERNFVDRDVYVEGKSVKTATKYFEDLWNSDEVVWPRIDSDAARAEEGRRILDDVRKLLQESNKVQLDSGKNWSAGAREVAKVEFLHDPVGQKDIVEGIAQALRRKLRRARSSIVIETPYLVPTKLLLADLADAQRKGVRKIDFITNSFPSNDSVLVQLGYEVAKYDLQRRGAQLWEFKGPNTLHAKSAVLDNRVALIGSFNLDPRSQHLNTETAVVIEDEVTARQLARSIDAHKKLCVHLANPGSPTPDEPASDVPLGRRIQISMLKLILPLLRGQL